MIFNIRVQPCRWNEVSKDRIKLLTRHNDLMLDFKTCNTLSFLLYLKAWKLIIVAYCRFHLGRLIMYRITHIYCYICAKRADRSKSSPISINEQVNCHKAFQLAFWTKVISRAVEKCKLWNYAESMFFFLQFFYKYLT